MEDIPGFRVYLITDRRLFPELHMLYDAVDEAVQAGIGAVQLREKDLPVRDLLDMAYRLREITSHHGASLFVNDRIDVALSVSADGVHLGGTGIPAKAARKVVGRGMRIGVSAHSVDEVAMAERDGADFVTLGPVYETPSKLRYGNPLGLGPLQEARSVATIPIFAIGGIKRETVREVRDAGAHGVAVISAILASGEVKSSAEEFVRLMA